MKKLTRVLSVFVAASMLFSLAACSDSNSKKKGKDKDKEKEEDEDAEFSAKDAKTAAEDYVKALLKMDSKKLKDLSTGLKDDTVEGIDYFTSSDSKDVYDAWLNTFEYEIEEDDIEVDDDEATVPVTVKYFSIDSLSVDDSSADSWISAIEAAETDSDFKLDIEVKYDEDEEKALVSNGDDVVGDFLDVVDVYIYVDNFVYYDDAASGSWSKSEYEATDTLEFTIEFADYDKLNGVEIDYYLVDPDYSDIYTDTITFTAGGSETIKISPADCNLDEFKGGDYYIDFEPADSSFYYTTDDVKVKGEEGSGNSTVTPVGDGDIIKCDPECLGTYDESTGVYTNEYFGFEYTVPEGMIYMDPAMLNMQDQPGLENIDMDFLGMGTDGCMAFHMFGKIAILDGADEDVAAEFVNSFLGGGAGAEELNGESVNLAGIDFIKFSQEGFDFLVTIKDSNAFFLIFGEGDEVDMDTYLSTFKAI